MPLFGNQFEYRSQPSALHVIVPRSRELDQIEAVPEWISHISHAPIFADLYFTVERGTEAAQSGNRLVEIGHDEIEVYRRPVPSEVAWHLCRTKFGDSRAVGEEEISACKLNPARAELPFLCEPEPPTIKLDRASEISNLDVGVDSEQGMPPPSLPLGAKLPNCLDHRLGGFTRQKMSCDRHDASLIRAGKEAVVVFR